MRQILTVLLVCFLHSADATTYYFSTLSGDDSRSSTQAKSPSTPWKTISKLNSYFSNLQPGDAVLFKRGETFYGAITVNKSGTSGSPIVIGAYGTGNRPIITSLVTLSGWTANSSYKGVYDCNANSLLGAKINMLLLNDVQKPMGRYPNSDASNKGYLILESHSGKTSITDKELSSSPNWKGAEVVIRTCHWIIERFPITGHSGNTIYYSGKYDPRDDYGYFIQNSIKTLDKPGEWYYNPSTRKVSMYFGSNSPSSYSVKASTISNLIYTSSKSYIVFENLTMKGANENGVDINSGSNISLKNCDVLFSGINGVTVSNHTSFKLEYCNVLTANNNGVASGGSNKNVIIRNNIIKNTYTIPGMGQGGNGQGGGIRISNGGLAEYNHIINSGYVGIDMSGNYTVVKNNYIDSFSFVKDDGAGIYMSNGSNITYTGRKIKGNIVLNGIGAPAGTNTTSSNADGIYLDDDVNGVEISGNAIGNANRGIYLHNIRNIVVTNNISFNNNWGQLHIKYDGLGGLVRNNTITGNIFFSRLATQATSVILTKKDDNDIRSMGQIDNNYYARPLQNTDLINTETGYNTSYSKRYKRDFPEWKSTYQKDSRSKLSTKTITGDPDGNIKFVFNTTQASKTVALNGNYVDAKDIKYLNSITLQPYTSAVLIKDGGGTTTGNKAPTVSITTPAVNSTYKGPATINMIAKATDEDGTISKVEFYNGTKLLHTEYNGTYSYSWANVPAGTYSLTAKATDNDGATTASAIVKVSVVSSTGNTAPTVSITTPVTNASYTSPAAINMIAKATDADGTIRKVEFYNGTKLLHTEYNGTYSYSWTNVAAGTYTLTAKATDNDGATTTSAIVKIIVGSSTGNKAPTVSITTPVTNTSYTSPASINMIAKATDSDGTISKVEFYNGTKLLHTEYHGTYAHSWTNVTAGTYTLTAKATDNDGATTTSAAVKVTVVSKSSRPSNNNNSSSITNNIDTARSQAAIADNSTLKVVDFKLFPNPAVNSIRLSFDGFVSNQRATLTIQSSSGSILKRYPVVISGKSIEADISSLNTGMFIITLSGENFSINTKFLKINK